MVFFNSEKSFNLYKANLSIKLMVKMLWVLEAGKPIAGVHWSDSTHDPLELHITQKGAVLQGKGLNELTALSLFSSYFFPILSLVIKPKTLNHIFKY